LADQKTENHEAALQKWAELRQKFPDSPYALRALVRIAETAEKRGRRDLAYQSFQALAQQTTGVLAEMSLLAMGAEQLKSNHPEESIATLDRLVTQFPLTHQLPKARELLKEAYASIAQSNPRTLPTLSEKYLTSFHSGEAWYQLGLIDYGERRFDSAIQTWSCVVTNYPRTPSAAEALFYKGETEYQTRKYDQAIGSLAQFSRTYPTHALATLALVQRGRAMMKAGYSEDAILVFKEVVARSPDSIFARDAEKQLKVLNGPQGFLPSAEQNQTPSDPLSVLATGPAFDPTADLFSEDSEILVAPRTPFQFEPSSVELFAVPRAMLDSFLRPAAYEDYLDRLAGCFSPVAKPVVPDLKTTVSRAENFRRAGLLRLANKQYEWAAKRFPEDKSVQKEWARLQAQEEATRGENESIEARAKQVSQEMKRGKVFYAEQKYEQALEAFVRVINLEPDNREALSYLEKLKRNLSPPPGGPADASSKTASPGK
jgi:outer membrane protein assembly factor BamD (BamD/ComL family)